MTSKQNKKQQQPIVTNIPIKASELKGLAIATDEEKHCRPILCCVNVKMWKEASNYSLAATNSFELVVVNPELTEPADEEYNIQAESLKKLKASDDYVTLEPYDDYNIKAHITNKRGNRRDELWSTREGNFPKFHDLIKDDGNEEKDPNFIIDYQFLAQVTKAINEASKWKKEKILPLKIFKSTSRKPVEVRNPQDPRYLGIIMPMRY